MSPCPWFDSAVELVTAVMCDPTVDRGSSLDVTFGTIEPTDNRAQTVEYADEARIPKRAWQPLSGELRERIVSRSRLSQPRCGLFAMEGTIHRSLTDLIADYPPERTMQEGIPFSLLRPLYDYLNDQFGSKEASIVHGATWDLPGLDTVTVNRKIGKHLGLHLDSWDAISFDDRDRSRTRLCVNIGPDIRSFLYVPIRLRDAARAVAQAQGGHRQERIGDVLPDFLTMFPDFPIIRMNIPPGMGYFADTDNLLHDGSSLLAKRPTLHFTMRGRYGAL